MSPNTAITVLLMKAIMGTETSDHITTPVWSRLVARARTQTEDDDNAEDTVRRVMLRLRNMRYKPESHGNIEATAITVLRDKAIVPRHRKRKDKRGKNGIRHKNTLRN